MSGLPRGLAKAELHLHLEGSLDAATLGELSPGLSPAEVRRRYSYEDFNGFLEAFKWAVGHLRSPDDYALAARRLLERLERENVCYAEITLSAGVILLRKQEFGPIYEAVTREARRSRVEVYWVLDAIRHLGVEAAWPVARLAAERAGDRVVAFGIGGDEARGPAQAFAEVFRFARAHGLRLTPHAGETAGAESVWAAVRLGADRVGHGFRAAEDDALLRHLRDHGIALEICLSSNVATGAVRSFAAHPVRRLFDAGAPIVLNTDDPAMFDTSLGREFELAAQHYGFTEAELRTIAANAFRYAFRRPAGWASEGDADPGQVDRGPTLV